MSLSCDHLVGDLRYVLGFAAEVAIVGGLRIRNFLAFTDAEWGRIVKHVRLWESRFWAADVLESNVCLGQPSSLNVDTLLRVVVHVEVLTHQIGDGSDFLVFERARISTSHSHLCGISQTVSLRHTIMVPILSSEVTSFMRMFMMRKKRPKPFSRSTHSPITKLRVVSLVRSVHHTKDRFSRVHMDRRLLEMVFIRSFFNVVTVITN